MCIIMGKSHVSYVCAHHVILHNHHQEILYADSPQTQPSETSAGDGYETIADVPYLRWHDNPRAFCQGSPSNTSLVEVSVEHDCWGSVQDN